MFDTWEFFPRAALGVIAAHALMAALRRRRVPLAVAAAMHVVAGLIVLTWLYYQGTTTLGLPSGATWELFVADLREAVRLFRDVQAPTTAVPGFVIGTAIAVWITPFLSDWSSFRLWAPFEALLPAFGLFVFGAMFGADILRITVTVLFLVAALGFLLLYRTARQEVSASWVRGDAQRGSRALLRTGSSLALDRPRGRSCRGAVHSRARDREGLVDWKELGGKDGKRVTVSPLVEIQSRLVEQRDIEVFTVSVDKPNWRAYWRLTALDSFDGRVWKSSKKFAKTEGSLPSDNTSGAGVQVVTQQFSVTGLAQIWMPAAFEPRTIDAQTETVIRWEPSTSTLIVDQNSSDGVAYSVTSSTPVFDAAGPAVGQPAAAQGHRRQLSGPARGVLGPGARRGGQDHLGRDHPLRAGARPREVLPVRVPATASRCSGATAGTASRSSCCGTRSATASSSPERSPPWPARSGCPPGLRWASPPGTVTPPTPTFTT